MNDVKTIGLHRLHYAMLTKSGLAQLKGILKTFKE